MHSSRKSPRGHTARVNQSESTRRPADSMLRPTRKKKVLATLILSNNQTRCRVGSTTPSPGLQLLNGRCPAVGGSSRIIARRRPSFSSWPRTGMLGWILDERGRRLSLLPIDSCLPPTDTTVTVFWPIGRASAGEPRFGATYGARVQSEILWPIQWRGCVWLHRAQTADSQ